MEVAQGYAAVRIEKTIAPADDEYAKQKAGIARQVEQAKGAVRFARWMASTREGYDIVTNEKELERF